MWMGVTLIWLLVLREYTYADQVWDVTKILIN